MVCDGEKLNENKMKITWSGECSPFFRDRRDPYFDAGSLRRVFQSDHIHQSLSVHSSDNDTALLGVFSRFFRAQAN